MVPTISGSMAAAEPVIAALVGACFQLRVSKAWQFSQSASQSPWTWPQLSQIHCGPRGAVRPGPARP